jgi:hypothetical protein
MKPRLFRLDDLINVPMIGILIAGVIVGALIWNVVSPNGESVPWQGWFVGLLTAVASMFIVVVFYVKRWQWISLYKYTSKYGVSYFYESGAKVFLILDVEKDTQVMIDRWVQYLKDKPDVVLKSPAFTNTVVLFRRAAAWKDTWFNRMVCGLAYWNRAEVGTADKIENTAHKHELSHIIITQNINEDMSEQGAHEIMVKVGV